MTPHSTSIGIRRRSGSPAGTRNRAARASQLVALAVLLVASNALAAHRTILVNGKVFTADPHKPWAEAIAVQGNKIIAVGSNAAIGAYATRDTTRIDLGGRTVVPGLNDAHVHVLAPSGVLVNNPTFVQTAAPGPAMPEILSDIAAAAESAPPGAWLWAIVGTAISDDPNANRFALDVVSPNNPVRLHSWTGHGIILNTKAMEILGISPTAPDPFAGFFVRVDGTDVLNGVLHEYAEHVARRKLYDLETDEALAGQYRAFAAGALAFGYTSFQDMAVGLRQSRSATILAAANLPMRARSICFPLTPDEPCVDRKGTDDDDAFVRFSGIKWITDGTPIERLAFLDEPYVDRPDTRGRFNIPDGSLDPILLRALRGSLHNHQILLHAVGDGAIGKILDAFDDTGGPLAWNDRRPRIEHGDLLRPEDLERVLDDGAVVVQNGTHLSLANVIAQRFTPATLATIQPLRSLLDAGIPLALGTDAVGRVESPWLDIFLTIVHPDHPAEGITVEEAVTAFTRGSAYAEFEENQKGTITPGKFADLAVLSQDVFTVPVPAIPATTSVLTMVNGTVAFDAGVVH